MNQIIIIVKLSIIIIFLALGISCTEKKVFITSESTNDNYKIVIMNELLKQPEYFHGQKIETSGIFKYEFENVALYKNKWSSWQNNFDQSFWLDFNHNLIISENKFKNLNNKNITVKGTLNVYDTGHLGKHAGTIFVVAYAVE